MKAQPGCLTDGEIRILIDDTASAEAQASWAGHVAGCADCRARLEVIAENAGAVALMLNTIAPQVEALDENIVLRKVRERRDASESMSPFMKGEWLMRRLGGVGRRGAIAGVAAIALMVAVIAAVPFSSLADVLTGFRVQQFSAITIPMDLIQQGAQASGTQASGTMDSGTQAFVAAQLAELGKLNTTLSKSSLIKRFVGCRCEGSLERKHAGSDELVELLRC